MDDERITKSQRLLFDFYKERYKYELSEKNRYISLMQNMAFILISLSGFSVVLLNNLDVLLSKETMVLFLLIVTTYGVSLFVVSSVDLYIVVSAIYVVCLFASIIMFFQFWMARSYRHIAKNSAIEQFYVGYRDKAIQQGKVGDPYTEVYEYLYDEYRDCADQNQATNRLKNKYYVSLRLMIVPLVIFGLIAYIIFVITK